ncbi:hypothetical protein H0H87_000978 [Tephrocybe sp. NHM501043]|nr:hypothetical protein H0H87_000978 [Tephrocybe sp. NHM501043]
MAQTITFSVDDTSPSLSYKPFRDTFTTANLTAGWNPYFNVSGLVTSLGATGIGDTFHVTSRHEATVSVTWKGTGITLRGYLNGNASYNTTLDGAFLPPTAAKDEVLVSLKDLPDEFHTISMTTIIPDHGKGAVYFDQAIITSNASSSVSIVPQLIDDRNISFQGQWGLQNSNSNSLHYSHSKGDIARTTFSGASFLLSGTTSPKAGTYSVILDNITSTFDGRSSSTNPDALLFYATGLDPTTPHDIQIMNEDGNDLLLTVGGFKTIGTGVLGPPSTSSTSGTSAAHSKGTIAALVLAGVLGFLIIIGFLFFVFVIRPQRRRDRHARMVRRMMKGQEAGALEALNIVPPVFPEDMELGNDARLGHHQKRSSGKSGFARWKREVEGGLGGIGLGISFRHSGSTRRRTGSPGRGSQGLSAKSSIFTLSSSRRGHGRGKRKAKNKHISDSSWSNSFALELPVRPDSADSYKEKDVGPSNFAAETQLSLTSGLNTLSYTNTPSSGPAEAPSPPSYVISGSNRYSNSNSLSPLMFAPHSFSNSSDPSQLHSQQGNVGILLSYDDPIPGKPQEDVTEGRPFMASGPRPSDPTHLAALAPRERGSAQYSSDDAASYLSSAATRLAIRGLSPRTSNFPEIQEVKERREALHLAPENVAERITRPEPGKPSPPNSETSFLNVVTPAIRPIEIPPQEVPELPPGDRLDVATPSPFMVNFPENSSRRSPESEREDKRTSDNRSVEKQPSDVRNLRSVFRLTPPSYPPSGRARNSFLDFGASSTTSSRSQSIAPSELSSQNQAAEPERSRWSSSISQITGLSRSGSSNVSIPISSSRPPSDFPYPTSLPSSPHHPEGHVPSRTDHALVIQTERPQTDRYPARALRLSAFGSPTDSVHVPMSVTERRLRHSGSTGNSGSGPNSSQLPPHPPLPTLHSDASPASTDFGET